MDKKAKDILFKTYWGSRGWKPEEERYTSPSDFEYAKKMGVMFEPLTISHDDCVHRIVEVVRGISIEQIIKAFLASLSSRRLDWRSGIASYTMARNLTEHTYVPEETGRSFDMNGNVTHIQHVCKVCRNTDGGVIGDSSYQNIDVNVFNIERIKWGECHTQLSYILFDLEQFVKEEIPEPTQTDIDIFKNMLQMIASSAHGDFPGILRERFKDVPNFKSSKNERTQLIEILAIIGILEPMSYERPTRGKNDWGHAEFWRGEDGYQKEIVEKYFGQYLERK